MTDNSNIVRNGFATEESAQAQAQETAEEMREHLGKLIAESPSRQRMRYTPDYSLTPEYSELMAVDTSTMSAKEQEEHALKLSYLKRQGLYTEEQRQKDIDYTLNSPLSESFKMRDECKAEIERLEREIESFDISEVLKEADAITAEYKQRMRGANGHQKATLKAEYNRAIDELEYKRIVLPKNDLKVKRAELVERYKVADQRIKLYISCNRDAINRQLERARDAEINENLLALVEYMEG